MYCLYIVNPVETVTTRHRTQSVTDGEDIPGDKRVVV